MIRDARGRIAVVRTPNGVFLPGGGLEPGEAARDAAEREAREECGFVVCVADEIGVADQYVFAPVERQRFAKRSRFFRAQRIGSAPSSEPDHRVEWMAQEAAEAAMAHASHAWALALDAAQLGRDGEAGGAGEASAVADVPGVDAEAAPTAELPRSPPLEVGGRHASGRPSLPGGDP